MSQTHILGRDELTARTAVGRSSRRSLGPGSNHYALVLIILTFGWIIFFLDFNHNYHLLVANNHSIRALAGDPGFVVMIGLLGSYSIAVFCSWLLQRQLAIFVGIWLFSLAVSETQISVLQPVMMMFRYSMMGSLIAYGVIQLFNLDPGKWSSIQRIAVVPLLLLSYHLLVNTVDSDAYLMMPMQLTMFVGIFFGFSERVKGEKSLHPVAIAFVIVGTLVTVLHLLGLVFAPNPFDGGRYRSWHLLATGFANNYVLFLIALVWYFIYSKNNLLKAATLVLAALGLYILMLSGSRNALLALVVATFVCCVLWKPGYLVYIGGIFLLILVFIAATGSDALNLGKAGSRLATLSEREVRFGVWSMAWAYIQKNFWVGYGLSANLKDLSLFLPEWESFDAHNAYLGIWLRLGFFGFFAYLLIYILVVKTGFKYLRRKESNQKGYCVLFYAIFCALFLTGLFEENLSSRGSVQQGLWAICAVVITHLARYRKRKSLTESVIQRQNYG